MNVDRPIHQAVPQTGAAPVKPGEINEAEKAWLKNFAKKEGGNNRPGPPAREVKKEVISQNNAGANKVGATPAKTGKVEEFRQALLKKPLFKAGFDKTPGPSSSAVKKEGVDQNNAKVSPRSSQAVSGKPLPVPRKLSEKEVITGLNNQFEKLKGKSLSRDEKTRIEVMVKTMVKIAKPSDKAFRAIKMNIGGTEYKTMINSKLKVRVYLPDAKVKTLGQGAMGIVKEVGVLLKGTASIAIAKKTTLDSQAKSSLRTENRILTELHDLAKKEGVSLAVQKKPHVYTDIKNAESSYETTKHRGDLDPKNMLSLSDDEKRKYGLDNTKSLANIGVNLLKTIAFGHKHGITHRDLKVENLAFGQDKLGNGMIGVYDWGLASDRKNQSGAGIAGTPNHFTDLDRELQLDQIKAELPDEILLEKLRQKQDSFGMCHTLLILLDTAITKEAPYLLNEEGNVTHEKTWETVFQDYTLGGDRTGNPADAPDVEELLADIEKAMGKGFTEVLTKMMDPDPIARMPVDQALALWQQATDAIKTGVNLL